MSCCIWPRWTRQEQYYLKVNITLLTWENIMNVVVGSPQPQSRFLGAKETEYHPTWQGRRAGRPEGWSSCWVGGIVSMKTQTAAGHTAAKSATAAWWFQKFVALWGAGLCRMAAGPESRGEVGFERLAGGCGELITLELLTAVSGEP